MLGNVTAFIEKLQKFDAEKCDPESVEKAKELMQKYTEEELKNKSAASISFFRWVCIQQISGRPY